MPWSREIRAGHGHPNGRLGRGERHCAPQRRAAGRPVWTTDVQPRVPCGCPVSPWPFFLLLAQGPLSVLRRSPQACLPLISSPWGGAGGGGAEGGVSPRAPELLLSQAQRSWPWKPDTAPLRSPGAAACASQLTPNGLGWAGGLGWGKPVRITNCDFAAGGTGIFRAKADLGSGFRYSSPPPTLLGRLALARSLQPLLPREGPAPLTQMGPGRGARDSADAAGARGFGARRSN